MSLHVKISPEAQQRLARQRKVSTLSSLGIACLFIVLVCGMLALFLLPSFVQEPPVIVTYQSDAPVTDELKERKVQTNMERKPSSPSSAMTKVIAASTVSDISIPVPDIEVATPSLSFGDGDDFGTGWGDGTGEGGGGASFFQQKVKAERVAFVIDYSASMRGKREQLMRKELKKSVLGLSSGMKYQLIFFAGPAWAAGDEVTIQGNRTAIVREKGGSKYNWATSGGPHNWAPKGNKQQPEWIDVSPTELQNSAKLVEKTKLVWGTVWEPPLEMALAMNPSPQVIFFMTDGVTGGRASQIVRNIGSKARSKGIVINTIALMQPKAHKEMQELAKLTGGEFTVIEENGKARKVLSQD